jgi:cellulose synthase/poly-beta-1,6-N-acetylglucosamine synthase-like glycosyltransferase
MARVAVLAQAGVQGAIAADATPNAHPFGVALLNAGLIPASVLMAAMRAPNMHLIDYIQQNSLVGDDALYQAMAAHWAVGRADFSRQPPEPGLLAQVDAAQCLAHGWIPWRRIGGSTVIACANPDDFSMLRAQLGAKFGHVTFAVAPRGTITAQLMAKAGAALAKRAETRLPLGDSCRNYNAKGAAAGLALLGVILGLVGMAQPSALLGGVLMLALGLSYANGGMKLAAAIATLWPQQAPKAAERPPALGLRLVAQRPDLPMMSIMVPLFRESRILARLIRRLELLDYPRSALEVIFLIEDTDHATAAALAGIALPPHMRALTIPTGTIRTKPRALNYGLDHCCGQIIGVYDAEDAPETGQLRAVAAAFADAPPQVACLQGQLDYFNPRVNWLSRCFTIEYATWWRVVLPGLSRLGLAIPLGGTTLFFRRAALVELGGWDAHNVTEDADLGLRLARRSYVTQLLNTTTYEEANCRPLPWIKQRSRWIKGYMITYLTHMRHPAALLRDLGAWRFLGMQMMFAGSVLQALLAPVLLLMWALAFGMIVGGQFGLVGGAAQVAAALGVFSEALSVWIGYLGLLRAGQKISPAWVPTMMAYYFLASLAAYKALYEMLARPFYWDKTTHGLFDA